LLDGSKKTEVLLGFFMCEWWALMKQGLLRWGIFRHLRMHHFAVAIRKQWRATIVAQLGTK
jgi:hypothetical protein